MSATLLVDSTGATIIVGQTVKLVGVVASINPFDLRNNEVVVTLSNPLSQATDNDIPGGDKLRPGMTRTIVVPAKSLTIGA